MQWMEPFWPALVSTFLKLLFVVLIVNLYLTGNGTHFHWTITEKYFAKNLFGELNGANSSRSRRGVFAHSCFENTSLSHNSVSLSFHAEAALCVLRGQRLECCSRFTKYSLQVEAVNHIHSKLSIHLVDSQSPRTIAMDTHLTVSPQKNNNKKAFCFCRKQQ